MKPSLVHRRAHLAFAVLAAALAGAARVPAVAAPRRATAQTAPSSVWVGRYAVPSQGQPAEGWLAYPTGSQPTTLLVYAHACCGKPDQSLLTGSFARSRGAVVVAMDYRGPGRWDVATGATDTVAATLDLRHRFPSIRRTVLWGVSMGGEVAGMAAAARADVFDYWVDTFGVTDLTEEFAVLGTFPTIFGSWIAQEAGGPPGLRQAEYDRRSPVHLTDRMRGLKRVYVLHGIGDMLVPYTQGRRLFERLTLSGVPASMYTFLTGPGSTQGGWTPAGFVGLPGPVGPAAHDGRGGLDLSLRIVDALLGGAVPDGDAGARARDHVYDHTSRSGLIANR